MTNTISRLFDEPIVLNFKQSFFGKMFSSQLVLDDGQFVRIKKFPYKWFSSKVKKLYGTHKIEKMLEFVSIRIFGMCTIRIHKFFIPELLYILSRCGRGRPEQLMAEIAKTTWVKDIFSDIPVQNDTDMSLIKKDMNVELFDWQKEFIEQYDIKRRKAHLHGELLSFGCGMGKTITALATMKSIGCDGVIVLAPKSTLYDVWVDHIKKFYKTPQKYWVVNDNEPADADFFILNYESMDKIDDVMKYLRKKNKVGVIVDESHNFLKIKSQRTQNLIKLRETLGCDNVLMMSGTPVKGVGAEVIPLLRVIDSFFDEYAQSIFIKAFGINTTLGADILHARLNLVMHRRKMEDVYELPPLNEIDYPVKIKNGTDYTIDNVKLTLAKFLDERIHYHKQHWAEYEQWWEESMKFFDKHPTISKMPEWPEYKRITSYLRKKGYSRFDPKCVKESQWAKNFEKNILVPAMRNPLKEHFLICKSKIKYLNLCLQGEVLGHLDRLRSEMTIQILNGISIPDFMNRALKKVIFATTYVDTVEYLKGLCQEYKLNPICVYGKTSDNASALLEKFRKDDECRVLICTIQTLSTGVTLVEANTVIFCNQPWRESDKTQMAHRCHRIGQDTECEIITLRLDTGNQPNLSDRTAEILDWSKKMTDAIVDGV